MWKEITLAAALTGLAVTGFFSYRAIEASGAQQKTVKNLREDVAFLRKKTKRVAELDKKVKSQQAVIEQLRLGIDDLYAQVLDGEKDTKNPTLFASEGPTKTTSESGQTRETSEPVATSTDDATIDLLADQLEKRLGTNGQPVTREKKKEEVKQLLDEIREQEEKERRERRAERRRERIKERVAEYAEKLHLQPWQQDKMTEIYMEGSQARRDLFMKVREGELDRRDAFQKMREMRDEQDKQVQELLGPVTYEEFEKLQEEERGRWGRRRGRRQNDDNNNDSNNNNTN